MGPIWACQSLSVLYYCINTIGKPFGSSCMQLHLSPTNGVPIYLPIVNQVQYLVASGRLVTDQELPG